MSALEHFRAPDGVRLATLSLPASGNGPVIILIHGIASHLGWYQSIGKALQAEGVSVYLTDRRGCGRSDGQRGHADSWDQLTSDLVSVVLEVRRRHPASAIWLYGISLGGLLATVAALRNPDLCDGLILSTPAFATTIRVPLLRRLRVLRRSKTQPTRCYPIPFGPAELVDRPDWRAVLEADPRRTREVSARFLTSLFGAQRWLRKNIHRLSLPVYCMLAQKDKIVDNRTVLAMLENAGSDLLWVETFEDAPHVLPSCLPSADLVRRLRSWAFGSPHEVGPAHRRISTPRVANGVLGPPPPVDNLP